MPSEQERLQRRAVRLEWITIVLLALVAAAMFLVMGSSQAMKTALVEDLLSLVPPIAYVIAVPVARRPPDERFPYGRHRAISIAFLGTAIALFATGALLLVESVHKLAVGQHPTIPSMDLLGWHVWQGWPMIAVLGVTAVVPVVLGRMKLPLARALHDKALHADADMNKADWLTGVSGILGITGIALGFWWADSVAAAFIALAVTRDGVKNLRRVTLDLCDRAPTHVEDDRSHELQDDLVRALERLPWVRRAGARLREEGNVLCGEAFVVARDDEDLVERLEQAREVARGLDWRILDVVVSPVPDLPGPRSTGEPSPGNESRPLAPRPAAPRP